MKRKTVDLLLLEFCFLFTITELKKHTELKESFIYT